ncbi:MAG TPA: hypothetical protein DEP28_06715 [Bacteroidetes bacterium]|nr:DUF1232 domain-containing protein [Ignavibacteria bacterium]HCA42930.1 hypothetical protein [Bacteroidota bacterium]HCN37113.1 hypothetical protein [Bacteroidota bacterium]
MKEEEKIINNIEDKSKDITVSDIDKVLSEQDKINTKEERLKKDKLFKLFDQVKLVMEMLKDFRAKKYTDIPWRTIGLLTAALLYFLNPFDIIPDFLPLLGYTEDAVAFLAIFKSLQTDLKNYCLWKGYDPDKYF